MCYNRVSEVVYLSILVVEDDATMREMLVYNLEKEGFKVHSADSANKAINLAVEVKPKIVLLDVMLPEACGISVCKSIKQKIPVTCIIMVSALTDHVTRQRAKESGSDCFVGKPFSMRDLINLINRHEKRIDESKIGAVRGETLTFDDIVINAPTLRVTIKDTEIKLSAKEYQLLYFMVKNPSVLLSRENIAKEVWGYEFIGASRTIDIHVNSLRKKLAKTSEKKYIKTVRGFGYMFDVV